MNNLMQINPMYNPNPMSPNVVYPSLFPSLTQQFQQQSPQNYAMPQSFPSTSQNIMNQLQQFLSTASNSQSPTNMQPPINNNMYNDPDSVAYKLLFAMYTCKIMNPSGNCVLDPNTLTVSPNSGSNLPSTSKAKPNPNIKVNINYIPSPTTATNIHSSTPTTSATAMATSRPLITPAPNVAVTNSPTKDPMAPVPATTNTATNGPPTDAPTKSPPTSQITQLSSSGSVFTYEQKKFIVDEHNKYRSEIALGNYESYGHPKAAKMYRVHWDNALEKVAQNWANTCNEGHTPAAVNMKDYCAALGVLDCHDHYDDIVWINGVGYHKYLEGQNMWGGGGGKDQDWAVKEATKAWFEEYDDPPAKQGHFTQVTNDRTTKVGCGYAYCPNSGIHNLFFCNYYLPNGKYSPAQIETGEDCPGGSVIAGTGLCD